MSLSFYPVFYSFSVFIGAKHLAELKEAEKAKFWSFLAIVFESLSYILNSVFGLSRQPKKYFVTSYSITIISLILTSVGYSIHDLGVVRLSNITHGISVGGIFGAYSAYYL